MDTRILLTATLLALGTATVPAASLSGIKDIEIRSTNGTWIQIAEVIATETSTGFNLALATNGATVTSGGTESGAGPAAAIDGIFPASYPNIYHSFFGPGQFLKLSLAVASTLDSFTIYGRTDCCGDRDVFDVQIFNVNNVVIFQSAAVSANNAGHSVTVIVPEPGTTALLGGSVLALARRRRRAGV